MDQGATSNHRILLVEDDPDVRETIREMLEVDGHNVYTVGDGESALEALDNEGPFSLVLSDVVMPRMGGFELVRHIRARPEPPPIALVSGYAATSQPLEWDTTIPMITKPFTLKRLLAFVEEVGA